MEIACAVIFRLHIDTPDVSKDAARKDTADHLRMYLQPFQTESLVQNGTVVYITGLRLAPVQPETFHDELCPCGNPWAQCPHCERPP